MGRWGNAASRKALYYPALPAWLFTPIIIRALRERLVQRGTRPMQIVGAATRKLLHLVFGVLKSERPFDPLHGQTLVAPLPTRYLPLSPTPPKVQ